MFKKNSMYVMFAILMIAATVLSACAQAAAPAAKLAVGVILPTKDEPRWIQDETRFMEAFTAINANFQDIFHELSHGTGRLELENPESPFEGGLIIRAQPRDKKMQRIEALSGGEKSLTALSFVFAFQRFAPAPFYAFDEVDMMLDGANAERLARMVKTQSASAQFVVVSLRRPMIENTDHAIGVSLRADGFSRVVGIKEVQLPDESQLPVAAGA